MRLFFGPLLLTIILLFIMAQFATPLFQEKQYNFTLPVHRILYLNRNIDDNQMLHILSAAMEWNQVTNGDVIFDIKRLPDIIVDVPNAIVIMNVNADFPESIVLDSNDNGTTMAFFDNKFTISYIGLIEDRISETEYDATIMHELGHALGLKHTKGFDGIHTLMYPTEILGAEHITQEDLWQFCKLYNCDSRKYHALHEEQFL